MLLGRPAPDIPRPPEIAPGFEAAESFLGAYGDPADPIVITTVDGHLFRDDSEFYPIAGGSYFMPASAAVMRFRRAPDGRVDAMITERPGAKESVALRVAGHQ